VTDVCQDPDENYPYLPETFALIRRLGPEIRARSQHAGVPPIAVAGSIADEYNTRVGLKQFVDWFQDEVLLNRLLPSFAIEIDHRIGSDSKLLNATMHDLGIGNIKLATARQMYEANKSSFTANLESWSDLVDYILTDGGTIHIAALVIKQGMTELAGQLRGRAPEVQEAILVTYYKQGPSYAKRFAERLRNAPNSTIQPGEGCRVFKQRAMFVDALGLGG
jgi:hypothetical protein